MSSKCQVHQEESGSDSADDAQELEQNGCDGYEDCANSYVRKDSPASSVVPDSFCGKTVDSDPFGLDVLINKSSKKANIVQEVSPSTPEFPPGFSPNGPDYPVSASANSIPSKESLKHPGFSMIERLEEAIKMGLALGLNMEGCESTLASIIGNIGDNSVFQ